MKPTQLLRLLDCCLIATRFLLDCCLIATQPERDDRKLPRQTDRQTDRQRERTDNRGEFDRGRLMRGVDQGSTRSAARGCLVQPERSPGTYCDKEIIKTGSSAAVHPMTDCIVQKLCALAERFIA